MRAFFDPDQRLHRPQQFMRIGRIAAPQDVPARIAPLLAALSAHTIPVERPVDRGLAPALAVHLRDVVQEGGYQVSVIGDRLGRFLDGFGAG